MLSRRFTGPHWGDLSWSVNRSLYAHTSSRGTHLSALEVGPYPVAPGVSCEVGRLNGRDATAKKNFSRGGFTLVDFIVDSVIYCSLSWILWKSFLRLQGLREGGGGRKKGWVKWGCGRRKNKCEECDILYICGTARFTPFFFEHGESVFFSSVLLYII